MQALYLLALDPVAEATADPHSYGFRRERSTADAMKRCFLLFSRKHSPQWVLEGDIKGCFDAISHEWLLSHIPMEKAMLKKWLKAGFMEEHVLYPTEAPNTTRGHLFTRISEYGARWPGTCIERSHPTNHQERQQGASSSHTVCR
jgi:retron-type reverse transcriptase